jgi:hypothetical protein
LPKSTEDLTFFFGRASRQLGEVDANLDATATLGISRMNRQLGKYVNVHLEPWSRIREITHDGSRMGVCLVEDRILKHVNADKSLVSDWFAILMEDATEVLGGYDLKG